VPFYLLPLQSQHLNALSGVESPTVSRVDEALFDEWITLLAQITSRLIHDSAKTTSNTTAAKRYKQIRLITVEDAARILGIARFEVFQALCARQKENIGKDILIPAEHTKKGVVIPILES